ncbi:hypothetical protein NCCP2222_23770 [Sporosarcina sp. NCCP-2222]|uniref:hypothetical protein n=1 Tax=Sporosarcina sp. NCCP-2222 TaxID=2935073 RepID=UPI002088B8E8|nr:hypothetical protein [Sporosarcina sp. NCCP-2222]GKV56430.1 hypothetical protein NCCP2222_23770 [Sporosarcina sp. NCCP-2222]
MVKVETIMNIQHEKKKVRWIVVCTLVAVVSIFLLTHFFAIYPGGYSLEKQNGEVLIAKGADSNRVAIDDSVLSQLKIATLELQINDLKILWYVGVIFTATTLLVLFTFSNLKMRKAVIIIASVYVGMAILVFLQYSSMLSSIDNSIQRLLNG